MKLLSPEPRNMKPALPGRKSASGDFFPHPNQRAWELPPQAQLLCGEKWHAPTTTVSGRGLWLSADPIKEDGGLNLYAYVGNDPVNMVDPDGLWPTSGTSAVPDEAFQARREWNMTPEQKENAYQAKREEAQVAIFDLLEIYYGDFVPLILSGPAGGEGLALAASRCKIATKVPINPKIYSELEKQLARDGGGSIRKALSSAEKSLAAHKKKLAGLKYKSQVEGTIQNVEKQIKTLKKFIDDKGL